MTDTYHRVNLCPKCGNKQPGGQSIKDIKASTMKYETSVGWIVISILVFTVLCFLFCVTGVLIYEN